MKTEAKNHETSIEPHYRFEKLSHPETGKVDILEIIRYFMNHLNSNLPNDPEVDGGYSIISMSINKMFADAGIASGHPELSRIMQEMALIKSYGRSQWGVLSSKVPNCFVTARSYVVARDAMIERQKRNHKSTRLAKQVKQPKKAGKSSGLISSSASGDSYEEEAVQALIEVEELTTLLGKSKKYSNELEQERDALITERDKLVVELAQFPSSVDAAKQAFYERIEAAKKARVS
jgi:hypothetical protein